MKIENDRTSFYVAIGKYELTMFWLADNLLMSGNSKRYTVFNVKLGSFRAVLEDREKFKQLLAAYQQFPMIPQN